MRSLLPQQSNAIEKLRKVKVGALFMDPGTGKTHTAIELVKSVPDIDLLIWLCPFQVKKYIAEEIAKCYYKGKHEIHGIESFSNSDRLYLEIRNKLEKSKNPFVVVDESLKIKNSFAKRTKRLIDLGKFAQYKLILNGTPLSKNLLDVWSQMEFLSPKILKMSLTKFKNTFVEYITVTKSMGRYSSKKEFIKQYHNIDHLYNLINPFVVEADLDISQKKQYVNLDYKIDDIKKERYYELKKKYLDDEMMEMKNNNIFLELTNKMQHEYCNSHEKIRLIEKYIENFKNEKILIFTKYIDSRIFLQKIFKDKVDVKSMQMHSFGLNMQNRHITFFYDKTWDYALRLQAEARTYRTGQENDCIYYDLTGDVNLEILMDNNIHTKGKLLTYFKKKSVKELMKKL